MRHAELLGNAARILNVLSGATGALLPDRGTMIVQLQGDADHLVARAHHQCGSDRRVDAARHGNNNALLWSAVHL
jgi:hypothetical protein